MIWDAFVDPAANGRLCWTLLHSVWQAALFALAACCIERCWRSLSVEARYNVHVLAMGATMSALPLTYVLLGGGAKNSSAPFARTSVGTDLPKRTNQTTFIESTTIPLGDAPDPKAPSRQTSNQSQKLANDNSPFPATPDAPRNHWPWLLFGIAAVYKAGVLVMIARLATSIVKAGRLTAGSQKIACGRLLETLQARARGWSLTRVPSLAMAERIAVPMVLGVVRPTILLPAAAVNGLSVGELEMILTHELAHLRRYDLWVSFLQRLAEAILFFNPVLWYLSRKVSTLREYCCDEMTCSAHAASEPNVRLRYASSLVNVVKLARAGAYCDAQLHSLAAAGRSPSELRRRVARLLGEPLREPVFFSRTGLLAMFATAALLLLGPATWQAVDGQLAAQDDQAGQKASEVKPFEFHLRVVGPDRKVVRAANIEIRGSITLTAEHIRRGKFVKAGSYGTLMRCVDGELIVAFPSRPTRFSIFVREPGFGPYWAGWDSSDHPEEIPTDFTAHLDAAWTVGGVVVDEDGKPVKGVKLHPDIEYKKRPGAKDQLAVGASAATDDEGVWRFEQVPLSMTHVTVELNHPDFVPKWQKLSRSEFEFKHADKDPGRIVVERGLTLTGTVADDSGKPVQGATVRTKFLNDLRETKTDDRGRYQLVGCPPCVTRVVVSAEGKAFDVREVRIDSDLQPVDFALKPGRTIRIRVVDEQGKGVPKSRIFFQRWRGMVDYFEFDHLNDYTDENGVWEWNRAPADEIIVDVCRHNGMQLTHQSIVARDEEYVFTPPKTLEVSGRVVDAQTKKPIQRFRVVPGQRSKDTGLDKIFWLESDSYFADDGKYRMSFDRTCQGHVVRIEADGYKVATSREVRSDEGKVTVDFELQTAKNINATVLQPSGKPAANASGALGVAGSQISIENGRIEKRSTYATLFEADGEGRISIPRRDEFFEFIITHPQGFAHFTAKDAVPDPIKLTPWARAEGVFRVGADVVGGVKIRTFGVGLHSFRNNGAPAAISSEHNATTDENGRFVMERVFPDKGRIGRNITLMVSQGATEVASSQRISVEFVAGKTTNLELGGTGRPVIGKLTLPEGRDEKVWWNFAHIIVRPDLDPPRMSVPAAVQNEPDKYKFWWDVWNRSEEGKAWKAAYDQYRQALESYPFTTATVHDDGSFRIDDMPAGKYRLSVDFHRNSPGALHNHRFEVEAGTDRTPVDLGSLTLE